MMKSIVAVGLILYSVTSSGEDLSHPNITGHHAPKHRPTKRLNTKHPKNADDAWTLGLEENEYYDTTYINPSIDYYNNGWDIGLASYNIPTVCPECGKEELKKLISANVGTCLMGTGWTKPGMSASTRKFKT